MTGLDKASRNAPDLASAASIQPDSKSALARLTAPRNGLAREAFAGAPRGIATPWPDNPSWLPRRPDWSFKGRVYANRAADTILRDALALLSQLSPPSL